MARWVECADCGGNGVIECEHCLGLGHELWDEEKILEGLTIIDESVEPCDECLGDREVQCDVCFGEGGEYHE